MIYEKDKQILKSTVKAENIDGFERGFVNGEISRILTRKIEENSNAVFFYLGFGIGDNSDEDRE